MKQNNRIIRVAPVVAIAALAVMASAANAQRPRHGDHRGPGARGGFGFERLETLADELDLTADQRAQIKKLRDEGRAKGVELRKQVMRLQHQLRGELLEDEVDQQAVLLLVERIGDARTKLAVHRMEHQLAMRSVLTPEQRDQLLTLRPHRGRSWRGPGFGPPDDLDEPEED